MEAEIMEMVRSLLGAAGVARDDRLAEDLEAESIDLVNLVAAVEDRYGLVLDHESIASIWTVGDLCDVVAASIDRPPA